MTLQLVSILACLYLAFQVRSPWSRKSEPPKDPLAEELKNAIFHSSPTGVVHYANPSAKELFRFENPENRSLLEVTLSHDLDQLVKRVAETGKPQQAELQFGRELEQFMNVQAWVDKLNPARIFISMYDITQMRRIERTRKDFVANVSHELRTPLTSIRAMAEILVDEDDKQLQQRYLSKTIAEVDHLTYIVGDLLTLTQAESSSMPFEILDLTKLAYEVFDAAKAKADAKGLKMEFEGDGEVWVSGNPVQLSQVCRNLIDNAINYSSRGQITVRVVNGNGAVLTVEDMGAGISSEHVPRIFERFYRIDKGRSRATGGTGLGLSIVKHIVESHGGAIEVETELNRGSTFTVKFPAPKRIVHPAES